MVGILIDNDVVAIPVPPITIGKVIRGPAKVEPRRKKPARSASTKTPEARQAAAAREMPALLKMVQIAHHPGPSHAPPGGWSRHGEHWDDLERRGRSDSATVVGFRELAPAVRRWSRRATSAPTLTSTQTLRPRRDRKDKHCGQNADNSLHELLLHGWTLDSRMITPETVGFATT